MTTQPKQFTHVSITVGATDTPVLAQSDTRAWVLMVNDSDETIYIAIGQAAVLNEGIRLNAEGGSMELSHEHGFIDIRAINAICASGSKLLLVTHA